MEVSTGLKDEYQKLYDLSYGDITDMYLNYGSQDSRYDPSAEHKGLVSGPRNNYGADVATGAIRGSLGKSALKSALNTGLSLGFTGEMPSVMSMINPAGVTMGLMSSVPGALMSHTYDMDSGLSKVGKTLGGMLGGFALGPVGGAIGGLAGLLGGDALADAFDTRESEVYRDYLEDLYGYFEGRSTFSQAPASFHTDMLDSIYGSEANFSSDFDASWSDMLSTEPTPPEGFDVDFSYLSNPELDYVFNPTSLSTSYDDGYDSTTFGYDIGGTFGGDTDPGGDRMGGLDSSW